MGVSVMQLYARAMSANSLDSRGPPNVMPDEPTKPRIRPEGKPYYDKDKTGSDIARVFQWEINDNGLLPLNTVARKKAREKNFVALNREEVKKIEDRIKDARKKSKEEIKAELSKPLWKSDKRDISAKGLRKDQAHVSNSRNQFVINGNDKMLANGAVASGQFNTAMIEKHRTKEQQGVLPNGIIPHTHNRRSNSAEPREKTDKQISNQSNSGNGKSRMENGLIKPNASARTSIKRVPSAKEMADFKTKMDETLKNHAYGQLPQYLKERKKTWQVASEPPESPMAPPGHVLMNYEEKNKTLAALKRAEADLLKRFNSLPVRTDTEGLKRKKQQLLKQLEEVDEAIRIFSRPKVYVKTDD